MSARPRLLLCGHTYAVAVNRAKAVALAAFYEVKVCAPDLAGLTIFGQAGESFEAESAGAPYRYCRLRRWPRGWGFVRFFLPGLGREIAQWEPDIVLCEAEPWSFLRWQAWAMTRWRGRGAKFVEFTWENVRRPGWKGWVLRGMYRAAAAGADGCICGNHRARELMAEAGVAPERLLVTGQLGIDEESHPMVEEAAKRRWRRGLGLAEEALVVGFCGRFVEEKGILDLLQACEAVRRDHPEVHLALMGSGRLDGALAAAAAERPWLRLLPPVSNAEVAGVIGHFDLLVLPSKSHRDAATGAVWEEQFGHILLEAMMCQVPSLGSRSGAIPEVLERSDVLFEPGSPADLAMALRRWVGNREGLGQLGRDQRAATLAKWSHPTLAANYAAFLNSL